jgi:predicted anti-sigma-YlaC factor YlaD
MDCQEVKNIAVDYLKHNLTEDRVTQIEEHLCICAQCRSYLSNLLDNKVATPQSVPENIPQSINVQANLEPKKEVESVQHNLVQYIILGVAGLIVLSLILLALKSSF